MASAAMIKSLNADFRAGYDGAPDGHNPYLPTSRGWEAFQLGRYMHQSGRLVDTVRPSRGDTWKTARGMVFRFNYAKGGAFTITREA